ncbi:hypothetical protein [Nonomuraea angiospora]
MTTVEVECACCGGTGLHEGRALCSACYTWHRKNRTLHRYPPLHTWLETLARIGQFAELRGQGMSIRAAARQLGVTARSGQRYEQRLKARQAVTS